MDADKPAPDTDASNSQPNPRARFTTPEDLMASSDLSDAEKHELLVHWETDLADQLRAIEEGMYQADPAPRTREGKLADQASRVRNLITELEGTAGS